MNWKSTSGLLISLSVALFLGKASLAELECNPQAAEDYSYKFCTAALGQEAMCLPSQNTVADTIVKYTCQAIEKKQDGNNGVTGDQSESQKHSLIKDKIKLRGYITPETYNDCFCNLCPKNSNSLGLCESQGSRKSCALVEGTLKDREERQVWRSCINDQELTAMVTNLQKNAYENIETQRFVIEDTSLAGKAYTCLTNGKFYVQNTKKCNNIRFGADSEIGFDSLTQPLAPGKDTRCDGYTIHKSTKLEKFTNKVGYESACLVNFQTDGTQEGKSTFKVNAHSSDNINAYFRDVDQWKKMPIMQEFEIEGGKSQSYQVMIVNTDMAGTQTIEFQAYQSPDKSSNNDGGSFGIVMQSFSYGLLALISVMLMTF